MHKTTLRQKSSHQLLPPDSFLREKNSSLKCLLIILARVSSKVNKASWSMARERVKGLVKAFNVCPVMTADH